MSTQPAIRSEIFQEVTRILNQPDFKRWGEEVGALVADCKALKVKDDSTAADASDKISAIKGLYNRIEDRRKEAISFHRGIVDAVNNGVKQWTEPLGSAESYLKNEVKRYIHEVEMQRIKEEQEAQRRAEKARAKIEKECEKIGVEPPKIPDPVIPKRTGPVRGVSGGKVSTRKVWKAKLIDIVILAKAVGQGKAQKELLTFNLSLANTLAKNGVRDIPGVEIYEETEVSGYAT